MGQRRRCSSATRLVGRRARKIVSIEIGTAVTNGSDACESRPRALRGLPRELDGPRRGLQAERGIARPRRRCVERARFAGPALARSDAVAERGPSYEDPGFQLEWPKTSSHTTCRCRSMSRSRSRSQCLRYPNGIGSRRRSPSARTFRRTSTRSRAGTSRSRPCASPSSSASSRRRRSRTRSGRSRTF